MALRYELRASKAPTSPQKPVPALVPVEEEEAARALAPVVEVLSPAEGREAGFIAPEGREAVEVLAAVKSNLVEVFPDFVVGSFAVPDHHDTTKPPALFSFYLDKQHLVFIEDGQCAAELLEKMADSGVMRSLSTAHCLYLFMKTLLMNDFVFLAELEESMEDLEEAMLARQVDVSTLRIMNFRRQTIGLGMYYQQIGAMADVVGDDENKLLSRGEAHSFDRIASFADRLTARAEALKEYSMQLHELHQTRISLKQNSVMQVLTIVTVLFAPLTLVTGWFGMNLAVMPGLDWPWLWALLIVLAVTFSSGLLAFFHRKGWL